jgi:DNA-binding MarR family transcriptional regulator
MNGHHLPTTTGHVFAQTCKLFRARAHALLGEIGLCRGQPFVLHALWEEEGIPHSVLAERLNVTPATVTNMLKRMEKAGLIERRQDEEDQRVSRAYLTDAGHEIRAPVEEMWRAIERQAFSGFSPEECDSLCQLLIRMQENLLREVVVEES